MAIPSNLIPVNRSQLSGSAQVTGEESIETAGSTAFSEIIPDDLFLGESIDQIRARTLGKAEQYLAPLSLLPIKKPSFGSIKNYIEKKIDNIKLQRRNASVKATQQNLKEQEDPFTYKRSLKNKSRPNTVLGRHNQ